MTQSFVDFDKKCGHLLQRRLSAQQKHVVLSVLKVARDEAKKVRRARRPICHCVKKGAPPGYVNYGLNNRFRGFVSIDAITCGRRAEIPRSLLLSKSSFILNSEDAEDSNIDMSQCSHPGKSKTVFAFIAL
jgi:hypothetical protein